MPILRSRRRIGAALAGAAAVFVVASIVYLVDRSDAPSAAQIAEFRRFLRANCEPRDRETSAPIVCKGEPPATGDTTVCSVSFVDSQDPPAACVALVWHDSVDHHGVSRRHTSFRILDGRPIPANVDCCTGGADFTWESVRPEQ
jgi:hypothetical protein